MTRYAVALGSNMGDRAGYLRAALGEMGRLGTVHAISGLYETAPIGGPDQDPYLNAVAILETSLPPQELLFGLQAIEADHDRVRDVRWAPRTIDLDIVAMDGGTVDDTKLQIPHPRAVERRFVLQPLAEVWPAAPIATDLTAVEALRRVTDQEVDLLAATWDEVDGPGRHWALAQVLWLAAIALGLAYDGSWPGTGLGPVRMFGGLLAVTGGIVVVVAARSLGRALTIMPEPVSGANLVEAGVYAHARHPMYGGVFMVMLGVSLLLISLAGALLSIGLLVFFWAKSGYEERRLRIAYPWYSAYRRRVRHRIVPHLL